jgi:hypothetical protein
MANHLDLTTEKLDAYIGRSIDRICPLRFGTIGDEHNHCAHFVGHALGLNHDANVGSTCAAMIWKADKSKGACIRVNELYNRVGVTDEADEKGCLVYVTLRTNAPPPPTGRRIMGSHRKKHVGILLGQDVWHYGNTKDKVTKDSIEDFEARFKRNYGKDIVVLFSRFPIAARFNAIGTE